MEGDRLHFQQFSLEQLGGRWHHDLSSRSKDATVGADEDEDSAEAYYHAGISDKGSSDHGYGDDAERMDVGLIEDAHGNDRY